MTLDVAMQHGLENVADWPELVAAGPYIIAYLGQLMVLAKQQDFSMADSVPEKGLEHLRDASSFRAILTQISSAGYQAFYTAHKNTYGITLELQNLPTQMKELFNMIKHSPPQKVARYTNASLTQIAKIADKCKDMSAKVSTQFETTQKLIEEVVIISNSKQRLSTEQLEAAKKNMSISQVELNQLDKTSKFLTAELKETKERVEESRKAHDEAIKAIPSSWGKIGMEIAKTAGKALCNMLNPINFLMSSLKKSNSSEESGTGGGGGGPDPQVSQHILQIKTALQSLAEQIPNVVKILESTTDEKSNGTGNETEQAGKGKSKTSEAAAFLELLVTANKKFVDAATSAKSAQSEANGKMDKLNSIAAQLKKNPAADKVSGVIKEMKDVTVEMRDMLLKMVAPTQSGQSQPAQQPSSKDDNPEQFIAEMRSKELQNNLQEKRYYTDKVLANEDKIKQVAQYMAGLKIEKLNLENITSILKEGLKHLTELRAKWARLTLFFGQFHQLASAGMHSTLIKAIDAFKDVTFEDAKTEVPLHNNNESLVVAKYTTIIEETKKFYQEAYHLQGLAKMYYNVSLAYFMPPMAALDTLMHSGSGKDSAMLNQLYKNATEISEIINGLVVKHREEAAKTVELRLKELAVQSGKTATKRHLALL